MNGTVERAVVKAPSSPEPRADLKPHPFDVLHGTDTGGHLSLAGLPATSLSAFYTTVYLGIEPSAIRSALVALSVRYEEFTFIDIGCGKGRALMVAAEFPFRKLVGVEITSTLSQIALRNVNLRADWKGRISILNQDAVAFEFPDTPLVVFLYEPFLFSVLRRVLRNLVRQLQSRPRETYILYADIRGDDPGHERRSRPEFEKVMSAFPMFRKISEVTYPFTQEEAAAEPSSGAAHGFTLYSVSIPR